MIIQTILLDEQVVQTQANGWTYRINVYNGNKIQKLNVTESDGF
jgi:hypothetical protein